MLLSKAMIHQEMHLNQQPKKGKAKRGKLKVKKAKLKKAKVKKVVVKKVVKKVEDRKWMVNGFNCKTGLVVLWHVVEVLKHCIGYVNHLKMEAKNAKEKLY